MPAEIKITDNFMFATVMQSPYTLLKIHAVKTAKSAVAMGLSVQQIVSLTGLSEEEIQRIAKEN